MPLHPRTLPAGFIAPCLPSSASQTPSGAEWLHEIKHDDCRVITRKDGERVKLYKARKRLTDRFSLIVEACSQSCIIDGGGSRVGRRRNLVIRPHPLSAARYDRSSTPST
jgi:bifunctional non-homologous end joining protein LigD